MINVRVFVKSITAENFWDASKPVPAVQISTNLNVVGINQKDENTLDVPFVFTINYAPAVAQISLKGTSQVCGTPEELETILKENKDKKPPPPMLLQSISNVVFLETIVLCRTLNIPPPIPLPKIPTADDKKKPSEISYRA
jgi:hypothetical protein